MQDVMMWSQSVLRTTPARWNALAEALELELMRRVPAPGEWSAVECLHHLVETERQVFPVRVERFLQGKDFEAFDPDAEDAQARAAIDAKRLAGEFEQLRAASLQLLSRLGHADLDRTALHPALGRVTLREMIQEWAGHDLMHTVQAERALMQPFIDGCGPWKAYFSDHVVAR
jgi:hypothetical protein